MVIRQFSDLPITQKLVLIMLLTSIAAVLVVSGVFGASEALNYRRNMVDDIAILADIIGTNSTAAITFEDAGLANHVLASLRADSSIVSANMYHLDGDLLASYHTGDDSGIGQSREITELFDVVVATELPIERTVGLTFIDAVRPVIFDDEVIGVLHLRASLDELIATLRRIGTMAIATVLIAILVAYLLSFRLQSVISRPILRLSDLMKRVSRNQDYSLRAHPMGRDEIGTLMTGFNDMLAQISTRDVKLAEANDRLKRAVKETLEAKETAESASSAKSDFLARMSHEIRTPMNGVLGMTDLLLAADLKNTERKFAETIRQSGDALLAVINDILDFSKIEAGKLTVEESDLDLREVIEGTVDLLYNRASSQGVELIGAIPPDICTTVRGDPVRLRQVLMNLVGNAVKFTHHGEIVIELTQEEMANGQPTWRFAVRDTGIGIEPKHLDAIFDQFAQADVSTTREYGGTGLGLAISKQLVELMGGECGVSSRIGDGSIFWFTLPLSYSDQQQSDDGAEFATMAGMRGLVVDDNETSRELIRQQLLSWGIEVVVACDTNKALEAAGSAADANLPFDLILVDFFMPTKDELALAADIRNCHGAGEPLLLALSSVASDYDEVAMLDAGFDSFLPKPVRQATLYEAIGHVLDPDRPTMRKMRPQTTDTADSTTQLNLSVLVVEDNPVNMQVARHVLMSLGCEVVEAENGQEALHAMDQCQLDVVLMDCQMPVMDGYTATRQRRLVENDADRKRLPIIALTANVLQDDQRKCFEAGMDDIVSKPFTRQILSDTLSQWCETAPGTDAAQNPDLAGAAEIADESILDMDALDQIIDLDPEGEAGLLVSLIETYVENTGTLMRELKESIQKQDPDGIVRSSHSLKSSSANLGAKQVANLMSLMEQGARNGDIDVAISGIDRAETEYDAAVDQLLSIKSDVAA